MGEDGWVAALLADLSDIEGAGGHFARARTLGEEALSIRRRLGSPSGVAHALNAIASVEFRTGKFGEAQRLFEESRELWDAESANWAGTTFMAGQCARRLGNLQGARRAFRESYPVLAASDASAVPELLQELGALALAEGNSPRAARLVAASDSLWQELGGVRWDPPDYKGTVASVRESLQAERLEAEWAIGSSLTVADAVDLLLESLD